VATTLQRRGRAELECGGVGSRTAGQRAGRISGAVAGLVAITPAAGFVGPWPALAIGIIAGAVCYDGNESEGHLRVYDALDAFGVTGRAAQIGALLTGSSLNS